MYTFLNSWIWFLPYAVSPLRARARSLTPTVSFPTFTPLPAVSLSLTPSFSSSPASCHYSPSICMCIHLHPVLIQPARLLSSTPNGPCLVSEPNIRSLSLTPTFSLFNESPSDEQEEEKKEEKDLETLVFEKTSTMH